MMVTILKRQPIPQPEPVELVDFTELYEKAAKLLSYRTTAPGQSTANATKAVLRELDIQPFDPASVERYKQRQLNKMRRPIIRAAWIYAIGCVCCAAPAVFGVLSSNATALGGGLMFLLTSSIVFIMLMIRLASKPRWTWHLIPLSEYVLPIPEFALETAVAIKELLNGQSIVCQFYVDELSLERRAVDPFLVLSVAGASFYLEVWNEPSFREKRTI